MSGYIKGLLILAEAETETALPGNIVNISAEGQEPVYALFVEQTENGYVVSRESVFTTEHARLVAPFVVSNVPSLEHDLVFTKHGIGTIVHIHSDGSSEVEIAHDNSVVHCDPEAAFKIIIEPENIHPYLLQEIAVGDIKDAALVMVSSEKCDEECSSCSEKGCKNKYTPTLFQDGFSKYALVYPATGNSSKNIVFAYEEYLKTRNGG